MNEKSDNASKKVAKRPIFMQACNYNVNTCIANVNSKFYIGEV